MNSLIIPPSPNWYETSVLACAPDNTLIYGARNEIVVIYDSQNDQPADVKIIPRAHSQKITSVNLNTNWGQSNKFFVTVAEDKVVKLWNFETLEKELSHSVHKIHNKVISATFAGDKRIISVSEEGAIVVWNLGLNQPNLLKDIFGFKVTVTCISTCPHANWLTAFGLKNGLVIVADLRKQGKMLYKLRGHDKSVLSLTWCPAPVNIFPKDPHNHVGLKKVNNQNVCEIPTEQISESPKFTDEEGSKSDKENIKVSDELRQGKKSTNKGNNKNIWTNLRHADDDELPEEYKEKEKTHPLLKVYGSDDDDFLKECQKLKNQILGEDISKKDNEVTSKEKEDRPILKARKTLIKSPVRDKELKPDKDDDKNAVRVELKEVEDETAAFIEHTDKLDNPLEDVGSNLNDVENESQEHTVQCDDEEKSTENEKDANGQNGACSHTSEKEVDLEISREETSDEVKREIPVNVSVEEEPRKEFLLASSAKEGHIYIWRAGTDGRMQTFLTVSNKNNNRRSSKTNPEKVWITLCWVSPTILLSSSRSGELLHWTLPKPKDKSKQLRLIHNDHSSLLFSIAAPTVLLNENNWLDVDEKKLQVWSVGQDRLLLNTSLSSERTNLSCYPTVGVVECFASSPLDPSRLAIGTGEGIIKVWDLSRPHTKKILMTNFYQKIQSKVVSLAWHPTNELQLAYATLEGRIGYLDISNKSKSPTLLPNFFKSEVHKIEWGPLNGNKEDLGLFAVAEGKLVAFNTKKSEKDVKEVDTPDNTFVYTFSWKPNYEMMLVGSKSGALISYSPDLKILSTHYLQRKLQTICWHPSATQSDASKYCRWFASVYNSKEIMVYDFGLETDNKEEKIVAKLRATDTVNCLAWSPFEEKQLMGATDDGLAQIWNVEDGTVLSTYMNPNFESILAVSWSSIDPGYAISAGKDHTIRIWKMSDYPARNDEDILDMKKKCISEIPEDLSGVMPKPEKSQDEPPKQKKSNKNNLLPKFYNPRNTSQQIADLRKLLSWKENSDGCVETNSNEGDPSILNVFGSNADMLKIIQTNENSHKSRGKYSLNNTLSLFKGDVSTTIKEAIEEKRVSPWVIMMAPMVSPKLWQAACEVFAQQLSEESDADPLEIATYYLACHKINEAVDVLCGGALFREALALAKCRLPENDPLVTSIIEKWASYSLIVGNFEIAAQCNIFLGKYEEAASVLFRRSDMETLEFAMELAKKSGNEELSKAVSFRYDAFKTEKVEKEVNGELPSKVEVMLEKEGLGECEDKKESKEEVKKEEGEGRDGGKMAISQDNEVVQASIVNDEEVTGALPSKVEVMLEKEGLDECEDKNESDEEVKMEEAEGGDGGKMATSLDDEVLQSSIVNDELITGREIRRSSSLGDNFRLSCDETSDHEECSEDDGKEVGGLLTTEEVKKLLAEVKLTATASNVEAEKLDENRNGAEKCP